eukprot:4162906-Prymnesium_polylepis.1
MVRRARKCSPRSASRRPPPPLLPFRPAANRALPHPRAGRLSQGARRRGAEQGAAARAGRGAPARD